MWHNCYYCPCKISGKNIYFLSMRLLVLITYLTEFVILSSLFKLMKNRGQITSISASINFKVFRKEFIIPPVNSFPVIKLKMFFLSIFAGHSISPIISFSTVLVISLDSSHDFSDSFVNVCCCVEASLTSKII